MNPSISPCLLLYRDIALHRKLRCLQTYKVTTFMTHIYDQVAYYDLPNLLLFIFQGRDVTHMIDMIICRTFYDSTHNCLVRSVYIVLNFTFRVGVYLLMIYFSFVADVADTLRGFQIIPCNRAVGLFQGPEST